MRTSGRLIIVVVAASLALGIDLSSKWLIESSIMIPPRVIEVTPFFNIILVYNTGISFGMFGGSMAERQIFLIVLNALIVTGLLTWAKRTPDALERFGLGLVCGGAIGNIADRWWKGGVTDFLDFHWRDLHWPAFNLADVAISVGFAIVLYASFRTSGERSEEGRIS